MPGRDRVPSFQLPSGTTAERDNSYNLTTVGNIFYNTDTSNVEIRHVDPTNSVAWRDLVLNNREEIDISGEIVVKRNINIGTDFAYPTTTNLGKAWENGAANAPIKINGIPLITQVHELMQTTVNNFVQGSWLSHTPTHGANPHEANKALGMETPVTVYPYAMSIATDGDGGSNRSLTFEIRATNTSQTDLRYNNSPQRNNFITDDPTTLRGKAVFTSVDENDTKWVPFTHGTTTTLGPLKIHAGEAWGVFVRTINANSMPNELVIKVYFYQG